MAGSRSVKRYVVLVLLVLSTSKEGCASGAQTVILWPGTDAFNQQVKSLPLSVDEAREHLISKTRDHPDHFFDRTPIFIVGDEYFFSVPSKIDAVSLQGFYVNGRTGVIEYRRSNVTIHSRDKTLPPHPFTETKVID